MSEKIAVFTASVVVDFDDAEQTHEEALESYLADHNILPAFTLESVQDKTPPKEG